MKNIPCVRFALLSLCVALTAAVHAEDGPTAAGTIVFSQDFSSNMDGFERSPTNLPVDRIQLAPDPIGQRGQVLRVIWLAGDNYRTSSNTMPRSWASSAPGYQYPLGTTVNYAFGYMTTSTNIDANLAQNIRPGGPLWEMQGDTTGNLFIVANGHTSWTSLGVKVVANRWYDIRVETKYVTGTGGHITVWIDGVQCFSKTGIGWDDPAGTLARFDCGIYNRAGPVQSDLTKSRTVYISNLSVGTLNGVSAASAPVFSPSGGTYTSAQTVTITSATSGASIRYTTDGSTPSETAGTLYSSPISISASATLKAIAFKSGLTDSVITSSAYTINLPPPQVAAPSFSPAGGTYSTAQSVTISTTTAGASIRYTTDGSTPSETAGTLYSGPVSIGITTTLKAVAYESGFTDSTVVSAAYTISIGGVVTLEAESLSPTGIGATVSISNDANASGGVIEFLNSTAAGQTITFTTPAITAGTYQVQLRYKTNTSRGQHTVKIDGVQVGGTVDQYATTSVYTSATLGNATLSGSSTHTIVMTVTGKNSAATQFYLTADTFTFTPVTVQPQVAAPTFSPAAGTYSTAQNVTISTTTSGATIRYTVDGSTPTETAGAIYSGPVNISATKTLKAIAYESGFTDSTVTSGTYTITVTPPPTLNFEAESLSPVGTGATVSTSNDANASGGVVEFLNSTAAGQVMTFTTPSIPAGTYQFQLRYWANTTRGQHTVKVDGVQVGGTIDQYATAKAYVTVTLGNVTFASAGTHSLALTVTGKNSAATQFYLTADKFTFVGQ